MHAKLPETLTVSKAAADGANSLTELLYYIILRQRLAK